MNFCPFARFARNVEWDIFCDFQTTCGGKLFIFAWKEAKEKSRLYTYSEKSSELGGIKIGEYIKCPPPFYGYISRKLNFRQEWIVQAALFLKDLQKDKTTFFGMMLSVYFGNFNTFFTQLMCGFINPNSRLLVSILLKTAPWKSGSRKSKNAKMAQNGNKI